MSQVWKHSKHAGGSLLVLLALADFANDEGICYPAQKTLAKKSRLSGRQVRRTVGEIVGSGELAIEDRLPSHRKSGQFDLFCKSGHLRH